MSSIWWWWEKDFSARGSHLPQAVGGWQDGEERKGAKRDFTSLYWVICTVCLHAEEYSCAHLFHLLICARVFECRTLLQQQVQRHVGPLMFDRKTLILQCCLIILVMLCLKFDWCGRAIGSPAWLCLVKGWPYSTVWYLEAKKGDVTNWKWEIQPVDWSEPWCHWQLFLSH